MSRRSFSTTRRSIRARGTSSSSSPRPSFVLILGGGVAVARGCFEVWAREFDFVCAPAPVWGAVGRSVAERVLVTQLFEYLREGVVRGLPPRRGDVAPAALVRKILQ